MDNEPASNFVRTAPTDEDIDAFIDDWNQPDPDESKSNSEIGTAFICDAPDEDKAAARAELKDKTKTHQDQYKNLLSKLVLFVINQWHATPKEISRISKELDLSAWDIRRLTGKARTSGIIPRKVKGTRLYNNKVERAVAYEIYTGEAAEIFSDHAKGETVATVSLGQDGAKGETVETVSLEQDGAKGETVATVSQEQDGAKGETVATVSQEQDGAKGAGVARTNFREALMSCVIGSICDRYYKKPLTPDKGTITITTSAIMSFLFGDTSETRRRAEAYRSVNGLMDSTRRIVITCTGKKRAYSGYMVNATAEGEKDEKGNIDISKNVSWIIHGAPVAYLVFKEYGGCYQLVTREMLQWQEGKNGQWDCMTDALLAFYVAYELPRIRHEAEKNNSEYGTILLTSLYNRVAPDADPKKKKRIRARLAKMLDSWKAIGEIQYWEMEFRNLQGGWRPAALKIKPKEITKKLPISATQSTLKEL